MGSFCAGFDGALDNFNIYNQEQTFIDFTDKKQYQTGFQSKYSIGYNFFENAI